MHTRDIHSFNNQYTDFTHSHTYTHIYKHVRTYVRTYSFTRLLICSHNRLLVFAHSFNYSHYDSISSRAVYTQYILSIILYGTLNVKKTDMHIHFGQTKILPVASVAANIIIPNKIRIHYYNWSIFKTEIINRNTFFTCLVHDIHWRHNVRLILTDFYYHL